MIEPKPIPHFSDYMQKCLRALDEANLSHFLSLGGALGLSCYLYYRSTFDVDAWWVEPVSSEVRQLVIEVLKNALQEYGEINVRRWGDVISIELLIEKEVVFSFQIAERSTQLSASLKVPWLKGMWLDSFEDLVASKMTALVNRGAPRDFRDIYMVCQNGLVDADTCWRLWATRQKLAKEEADLRRARMAVRSHLARIERARPLENIMDIQQREEAANLRQWFTEVFCHGD